MREGWTYKKLGEVATYINGFPFKPSDWGLNGKPIIRIQNLTNPQNNYNRCTRTDIPEKYFVKKGDVLISWSATLGIFEWNLEDALLNQHIFKVVFDKIDIDKQYFKYAVNISISEMAKHTNGATMKHIRKGDFDNIKIPFPPLSEQKSIVSRLDSSFAKIDALKANAEKQLSDAKALFQKALEKAMEPKEGWEEKKFKDLCSFVRGPFGGSLKKSCFVPQGYAVYEQQNAIYNKFTFRYFINEEKYQSMIRFSVAPGDLIMSCSGTIGKVAIVPEGAAKGIINQALLKLSPKNMLDKYYLKYLMESSFFDSLISHYSDGAAIKNIASVAILKEIELRIPPLSEQQRIVERLDNLSEKVKKLQEIQEKTIKECDALKQAILRQVFE